MMPLKPAVDLESWVLERQCPECESVVGVQSTDISYNWDGKLSPYQVQCCLCLSYFRIEEKHLPKLVQADAKNNRYISHPCND